MKDLGAILEKTLQAPRYKKAKSYSVFGIWERLVGPGLAAHAAPQRIQDGILFITVEDAVWANELFMWRSGILKKMHQTLGDVSIRDIRFFVGEKPGPVGRKEPPSKKAHFPALHKEAVAFDSVDDAKLRRALEDLFQRAVQAGDF